MKQVISESVQSEVQKPQCWCGNTELGEFSVEYLRCSRCESLVARDMPRPEISSVADDSRDFYGRGYWYHYQPEQHGYPNIEERAWSDLPERGLHWLETLLKYKRPPARVLELGCAPGGFVALLRWAGFDATGLELSPSIVEFVKKTFGVPVLQGPVERQDIAPGSLDVIALMDVLEHFPDPVATMRHCLGLLQPDGFLMVQTPLYPAGVCYREMAAAGHSFLQQLKPREHLYLFSRQSVRALFTAVGAPEVRVEPPIYAQYDQFLMVSRTPMATLDTPHLRPLGSPSQRMVQALLDLRKLRAESEGRVAEAEADRAARFAVIRDLGERLGRAESERNDLAAELADLRGSYQRSETDRTARLAVIQDLGERLGRAEAQRSNLAAELADVRGSYQRSETDRVARLAVIQDLGERLSQAETQRSNLAAELADLWGSYQRSETDRTARLAVIEDLGERLSRAESERNDLAAELTDVRDSYQRSDADRVARLAVIEDLGERLGRAESERNDLAAELTDVRDSYRRSEADRAARLAVIEQQAAAMEVERKDVAGQLAELRSRYDSAERDRVKNLEVIEEQARRTARLEADLESLRLEYRILAEFVDQIKRSLPGRVLRGVGLVTFPPGHAGAGRE